MQPKIKKQIRILDDSQKEILAIYQACKAFIANKKLALLDEGVLKDSSVFPSFKELKNSIKIDLAGTIGLELLKNEKYFVSNDDLKKAYDLASKIVEEYKMALNANELIVSIKDELRATLSQNIEKIEKLKEIMLKNEVITLEDLQ